MPSLLSAAAGGEEDRPLSMGVPTFLFFFPQVATYGVRETRQIPQYPFCPKKAGLITVKTQSWQ